MVFLRNPRRAMYYVCSFLIMSIVGFLFTVASRTIWFGRIPNCQANDIEKEVKEAGTVEKINIVGPRGCAYVTMSDRRSAFKASLYTFPQ